MPFSTAAKNAMLNAIAPDRVRLHSGDPGADGTANALGAGLTPATFNTASAGVRLLAAQVTVPGLTPGAAFSHYSVWASSGGPLYLGSAPITGGNTTADDNGQAYLAAGSPLTIADS